MEPTSLTLFLSRSVTDNRNQSPSESLSLHISLSHRRLVTMEIARNQRQRPIRANGKRYPTMILLPLCLWVWFKSHSEMRQAVEDVTDSKTTAPKSPSITCPYEEFEPRKREEEDSFRVAWTSAVEFVRENRLTFLPQNALEYHRSKLYDIESRGVPGTIVECGVAKAGSSISIAAYKNPRRCLHLFDTFEGIPQPSAKDGRDVFARYRDIQKGKAACERGSSTCNKNYYGNMDNLLAYDISQFENAGIPPEENAVYFHKGLFDDTVWPKGPIAYAHLVRYFPYNAPMCLFLFIFC